MSYVYMYSFYMKCCVGAVQGTQEDPPKQMRDALKCAHLNLATARHVILMSNDSTLLGKMSTQYCVHAHTVEHTVKLLEKIVRRLPKIGEE